MDGLGPSWELPAQAYKLALGVGKVSAFHEADGLVDGRACVRPFLIEPAFPKAGGREGGRDRIGEGQAIGQFVLGANDDELEQGFFLLSTVACFKYSNELGDAVPVRSGLLRRRNKLFIQADHARRFPILAQLNAFQVPDAREQKTANYRESDRATEIAKNTGADLGGF